MNTKEVTEIFNNPFMVQRKKLCAMFGNDYITQHPELIAAAVIAEELNALRLELTRIQIVITDINSKTNTK